VVAQLLVSRGVTDPSTAREFLDPKLADLRDPQLLPGCEAAASRIHQAVRAGKRICIHGDYDVDGMTGTALLWMCLKLHGADVGYYIPHRLDEGYGLSAETIRAKAAEKVDLIVTVDCGIGSVEQAALARQLGMELIITDHHEPSAELPDASAIIHPRLPGGGYPFGGLSGSGVAFKLAWAICQQSSGAKKVGEAMKDFLLQAVGLAALGTVADVVPLVDENRVLVRHGLASLAQRPTLGMAMLMRLTEISAKKSLDCDDLAFTLAPRLNAAGRLGQPQLAVELLVTDRPDRAQELAKYIDQLNATRQTLERSIQLAATKQAKEQFDLDSEPALVLAERGWHPGVIGIVAGRLADKFHRPVVLIAWDQMGIKPGIGSARSVPGFNLHAALEACDEFLISHGGHAAAAGLKIEEDKLPGFRAAFCEAAAAVLGATPREGELAIDAEAPLSAFTLQAVQQIERLAPFGQSNARPLLCTTDVTLAEPPRTIGNGGHHLALKLTQYGVTFRAVAFGGGDWIDELAVLKGPIDIAFRPVINTYRGRQNVELHLVDWRAKF
jgi:single-stranded-DNA-specific exonuclease